MTEHNQVLESATDSEEVCAAERSQVEQRRYHRLSVNLSIQVSWVDAFGFENEAAGVVKNVSAGGFGIEFRHNRPLGSRLKVESETSSILCAVRHSQPREEGFHLGLEVLPSIDEAATWYSLDRLNSALSGDADRA